MENGLNYIVVEGPIGVGKSRLAEQLAERMDAETLLERSQDNPFLERFYRNPREGAFPTQLFFLMQRAEMLSRLRQSDLFQPRLVGDFLFAKDRLFAQLNLDAHEFDLYDRVWQTLSPGVPAPDLVIYLQAPVEVLQERLRRYARGPEARLDSEYLERLAGAYVDFFHHYSDSPVLIVNSAAIDPANESAHLEVLIEEMKRVHSGRHYFNPDRRLI
ncbi:MAG: deoxynucleoside kinase [Spiribacter sp.]|jgi:deoxyadenosine/deoxycytidine kinase|nr:deoxynucleoside kinase [Spiribacter sp.]MDR9489100.1 deoxynucleoside kinase [Spiribacter sp.]